MQNATTPSLDEIGLLRGIDQSSSGHSYLGIYETLITSRGTAPKILIVGATNPVAFANTLAEFRTTSEVLLLDMTKDSDASELLPNVSHVRTPNVQTMHSAIAGFGPVDILIEDGHNTRNQKRELLRNLIYHVRDGGHYVVEDLHAIHIERLSNGGGVTVLDDITRAWTLRLASESMMEGFTPDDKALAQVIHKVELVGKLGILTKQGNHAWKIRDVEFKTREPYSQTLMTIPAQQVQSLATVTTNNDALREKWLKDEFSYCDLHLRSYSDVVAVPGQVFFQGSVVLPDTFRHILRRNASNRNLEDLGARVTGPAPEPSARLAGAYFALDSELPGHFGHVTSEVVSRLWGWSAAKRRYPNLKALVSKSTDGGIAQWEYDLLSGAGISAEEIEIIDGPVNVEILVAASPTFSQPAGVSPTVTGAWKQIGYALMTERADTPDKIFIGRKPGASSRLCRNWRELEARFVAEGFLVVYPEDLPFPEQVTLFRNASTIAGYAGSAMFSLMFTGEPKKVIVIGSESYDAVNEYLIASVLGGDITYFWCIPDIPHPATGWKLDAFMSDYEFDFERDGRLLDQVLS